MKQAINILSICLLTFVIGCKSPEARAPISIQSGSFLNASAKRNIKLNKKEKRRILKIIKKDKNNSYIASKNGFWYTYHNKVEAQANTPKFGDVVTFNYNIAKLNGEEIYSENDIGNQSYAIDQEVVFTGLREGLKLMKPTEKVTFLFPSQKAFGYYGDDNKIGTNVPIKCTVTLNTITKKND